MAEKKSQKYNKDYEYLKLLLKTKRKASSVKRFAIVVDDGLQRLLISLDAEVPEATRRHAQRVPDLAAQLGRAPGQDHGQIASRSR